MNEKLAETILRLAHANPHKLIAIDKRTHPAAWEAWRQFYRQNGLEAWTGSRAMGDVITVLAEFPPGDAKDIERIYAQ